MSNFFKKHLKSRPGQPEKWGHKKCHHNKNRPYYRSGGPHKMHITESHCFFSEGHPAIERIKPDDLRVFSSAEEAIKRGLKAGDQ